MKIIQFTWMLLLAGYAVCAQGVRFEQNLSWKQVLEKARAANRYVMVDAYATWCGPCKEMNRDVFPQQEVGDFFNEKFISVKVQMDQTAEDNEHVKSWYKDAETMARDNRVGAFPTILFFSPDGELAYKVEGYRDVKTLIADANEAIGKNEAFAKQYDLFSKGKRDTAFVKQLAINADRMGRAGKAREIAQAFVNGLSLPVLMEKNNLGFAYHYTSSSKDRCFDIFVKQPGKVNEILGSKNAAERKIRSIATKEEVEPYLGQGSEPDWKAIEQRIRKKYGALGLEGYYGERMMYASDREQWADFGKYYALYFSTAHTRSKYHINNISWGVFEHVNDPKVLEVAIKTMKYNLEHYDKKDANSFDTYANLLYKAGRKAEALKWQEDAVALDKAAATRDNRPPSESLAATLAKMKAGKPTWE